MKVVVVRGVRIGPEHRAKNLAGIVMHPMQENRFRFPRGLFLLCSRRCRWLRFDRDLLSQVACAELHFGNGQNFETAARWGWLRRQATLQGV